MIIGIDVDGVLVDQANYQLKYGAEFFCHEYNMQVKNPKGFDIQDIFQCSKQQREAFWQKYIWAYCLKEPMTKDAARVASELRRDGHKVIIVTGRAHTTEQGLTGILFRAMLKHWLKKNKFPYDEIIFCSESKSADDKVKVCLEKKIDIMVDDKTENLFALRDSIEIICYSAVWNEDYRELDENRVKSMAEIPLKIQKLASKNRFHI